jgi:hypothetical protein
MGANQDAHFESLLLNVKFDCQEHVMRWVMHGLQDLADAVRPTHFGETERIRRKPTNLLSDHRRFAFFLEKHKGGFWLYGVKFKVNVTLSRGVVPSEVAFWASAKDARFVQHTAGILQNVDEYDPVYGFACDWDEYRARNGYTLYYVDHGHGEDWCGRDFRRYVPGLYWYNYFGTQYVEQFDLDLASIQQRLKASLLPAKHGHLLRLYDSPTDWQDRRDQIDDVLYETENFFSIRRVELPTHVYFKDSLTACEPISARWP